MFPDHLAVKSRDEKHKVGFVLTELRIQGRGPFLLVYDRKKGPEAPLEIPVLYWDDAVNMCPKDMAEVLDRSLLNLEKLSGAPGRTIAIDDTLTRALFSESSGARDLIIDAFSEDNYLHKLKHTEPSSIVLDPKGWVQIGQLRRDTGRFWSKRAFVAMSFSPDMETIYQDGIKKGIEDAGYEPVRISEEQFNSKICDRIIAEIRASRFVVADFTKHRQNVYFEAGYAMGGGITVIWTCKESDISSAHFDTRQYNHICWTNPEELRQKLKDRIMATVSTAGMRPSSE
jgi:nucleoside 2-deoxyribosyltransferase